MDIRQDRDLRLVQSGFFIGIFIILILELEYNQYINFVLLFLFIGIILMMLYFVFKEVKYPYYFSSKKMIEDAIKEERK